MVTVLPQLGAIGLSGASAWDMEDEVEDLATEGKTVTMKTPQGASRPGYCIAPAKCHRFKWCICLGYGG